MRVVLFLLPVLLSIVPAHGFFGKKKEAKKEEEKLSGKDSAALGMMGIRDLAGSMNVQQMMELQESMKDPETLKEVQALMNDPEFKKEMDKITSDPMFTKAMLTAQSVMGQEAASSVYNQKKEAPSDFELGMGEMARAAKNPKVLAEALEMLKDPEVAAQVEAMMKDPKFVAEARKLSNNPNFKEAMSNAAEDIERLSKDPAVMSKLKAQML